MALPNFDESRAGEILNSSLAHAKPGEIPLDIHAGGILALKGHLAYNTSITQAEFLEIVPFMNRLFMALRPDLYEGGENSPYKRMEKAFIKDIVDIKAGRL